MEGLRPEWLFNHLLSYTQYSPQNHIRKELSIYAMLGYALSSEIDTQ
ncbi:hypothetical protein CYPRO_3109 [Cyclonatronum proteinivorum]|uniref:Uncharacterized protein n=1 Tax=Cyclonatronum proteinivorum TaxID=1457365 RepID=A0A345UPE2_9BACT|nr:hypothetical protein CYPRO_3109 [Cyclonatronum proteinivorum]